MIRPSNRASIRNISDYSPFGVQLSERTISGDGYRYGFGGHEKDNEVKGEGNHYSFGNFGYDPRVVRRWNIDPVTNPSISPYAVFNNNPLIFIDIDGRRPLPVLDKHNGLSWRIESGFGARNVKSNAKASKFHRGVDLNAGGGFSDYGAIVVATHDGIITEVHESTGGGGGRYITVTSADGTFQTKYLHLSKADVIVGQIVTESQPIGKVGASAFGSEKGTASHLHYDIEVKQNGAFVKIDPLFDSDQNANTGNDISKLVDPQLWVNGTLKVGTKNPAHFTEIEEVIVRPRTEIGKLEIKPIGTIESSSDQQRTIEPTKVAEPTKSRPKH